ncbi:lipoprotein NlpI [Vibrio natriegens]|jgi:lipoprotein NlpI|uniref:lipoprotein NlpI n=1 Tax=Vibrio natriegens TaxID=691 RepID=UPI001F9A7974|nr:lipoprotein NlpI [Vibrio natriegens]MCY9878602.1 lipoprotein NlpI [Vibrio natriegens]CAH0529057.1 Lipoprotein NlpI [Catenococcus thiocycli]
MVKWYKFYSLGALIVLTGCNLVEQDISQESSTRNEKQLVYPAMAVPLQPNAMAEANIAKLNHLLTDKELDDEARAEIYLKRGLYYDEIGLRDLASTDYAKSLEINPQQPDIYNLLGMYYTQLSQFDAAYDAFYSSLELDPSNKQAIYNRAIALYYGGRPELALEDMKTFHEDNPNDPFRAIWLYIIESDVDKTAATAKLQESYKNRTDEWGWVLAGILLNEITEENAVKLVTNSTTDNKVMAQRLTEAYFYLGKYYMEHGDMSRALSVYKLAISLNVCSYNEHSYAYLELERISKDFKAAKEAGNTEKFVSLN